MPVTIVRLSDGYSWILPTAADFGPFNVIGIDCTHVYLQGMLAGRYNIARVAIASLGQPQPPD
jgi:hypothetical protein